MPSAHLLGPALGREGSSSRSVYDLRCMRPSKEVLQRQPDSVLYIHLECEVRLKVTQPRERVVLVPRSFCLHLGSVVLDLSRHVLLYV
jgi:hypothetical protein